MRKLVALLLFALAPLAGAAPVVVELFTSQGCSSCPPADALISKLRSDPNVIAIAWHVDYWDRLGWRDPFSSREATMRQMAYVRALRLPSAYTPQIVVAGAREMIGSNESQVRKAVDEASKQPSATSMSVSFDGRIATVTAKTLRNNLELLVVAVDDAPPTPVARGENAGRTIPNDAIARKLVRLSNVGSGTHRVAIDAKHVVAMLQDPDSMRIVAAAAR